MIRLRMPRSVTAACWCAALAFARHTATAQSPRTIADSLFRAGEQALNHDDYRNAAAAFLRVAREFPDSPRAPDAVYWRAFSLYRIGGREYLEAALRALDYQAERYPRSADRGDAADLADRVRGVLARGDDASDSPTGSLAPSATCQSQGTLPKGVRDAYVKRRPPGEVLAALRSVLADRSMCSVALRRHAIALVAQTEHPARDTVLADIARSDLDDGVRRLAMIYLVQQGTRAAADLLGDVLQTEANPRVIGPIAEMLERTDTDVACSVLARISRSPSVPVQLRVRMSDWLLHANCRRGAP